MVVVAYGIYHICHGYYTQSFSIPVSTMPLLYLNVQV